MPRHPTPSECEGELPTGWAWARIDDTGEYVNGLAFKNADWRSSGVPIIRIQNLTNPSQPFNYADGPFPADRMVQKGDLLVSWSATLNAFRWHGEDAVVNQHIFKVIPEPRVAGRSFLLLLLRHSIRAMAASEAAHGLVMDHINRGPFLSFVVAIPPLEEQRRIVTLVGNFESRCDELGALQLLRDEEGTRFRRAALANIVDADREQLPSAWQRVQREWSAISESAAAPQELRRASLDLAIRGNLTSQRDDDEPAGALLDRSMAARNKLLEEKKTRIVADHADYWRDDELPAGWIWAPLQDLVRFIDYRGRTPKKTSAGIRLITAKNIRRGYIDRDPEEFIAESAYGGWMRRGLPRLGDVLFTTEAPMGNAALVRDAETFAIAQRTINLAPYADFSGAYLEAVLLSSWFAAELAKRATGMTATGIKAGKLRLIRVPVPPVNEQHRIVAKLAELSTGCADLQDKIDAQVEASKLLLSLVG